MATVLKDGRGRAPRVDPLPADIPRIRDGHLGAVYYGQRRSGDFYDFVRVNNHRVLFGLFDIAGELETTRPIMIQLQEAFRSYAPQLLQTSTANEPEAILELWIKLNKAIMKAANGIRSCPAFLGCYNEDVKMLCYVNAGHTPGLCRIGNHTRLLEATALPLGLFSHSIPDSSVIVLGPGNGLLLVSSGVVEAKHRGQEFGLERAREYFHQSRFESAHETCVGVLDQVRQFMGTAPTHNDVTALSLIRSTNLGEK